MNEPIKAIYRNMLTTRYNSVESEARVIDAKELFTMYMYQQRHPKANGQEIQLYMQCIRLYKYISPKLHKSPIFGKNVRWSGAPRCVRRAASLNALRRVTFWSSLTQRV